MISKTKWFDKIESVEQSHQFTDGFKLLYCRWSTIDDSELAFVSKLIFLLKKKLR